MSILVTFKGSGGVEDIGCADTNHSSMKADEMPAILATERWIDGDECYWSGEHNRLLGNDMTNEIRSITSKFDNLDPRCDIFRLEQDQSGLDAIRPTASLLSQFNQDRSSVPRRNLITRSPLVWTLRSVFRKNNEHVNPNPRVVGPTRNHVLVTCNNYKFDGEDTNDGDKSELLQG